MSTLYVAGPVPRETVSQPAPSQVREFYEDIDHWCAIRAHRVFLPFNSLLTAADDQSAFLSGIRGLIRKSTHVLVASLAESAATGIEAEFAHQLGKPIAVWYPDGAFRSKLLLALATVERREDESIQSLLARFV
jgi:hypothetical protein